MQKLVTYESTSDDGRIVRSMIDFLLVKRHDRRYVRIVKVIPSEECVRPHHLVVGDIVFKDLTRRSKKFVPRSKIWKLKEEICENWIGNGEGRKHGGSVSKGGTR